MRRAAKVDANQPSIVDDLRLIPGVTVQPLSRVGDGCPDILVGYRGANFLFEIKDPTAAKSDQELNPAQQRWHDEWTGQARKVTSYLEIVNYLIGHYSETTPDEPFPQQPTEATAHDRTSMESRRPVGANPARPLFPTDEAINP